MIIGAQKKHSNLPARTIKLCRTHRNYVCNECKYMRGDSRECNGRRMVLFVRHPIRRDLVDVQNRSHRTRQSGKKFNGFHCWPANRFEEQTHKERENVTFMLCLELVESEGREGNIIKKENERKEWNFFYYS